MGEDMVINGNLRGASEGIGIFNWGKGADADAECEGLDGGAD